MSILIAFSVIRQLILTSSQSDQSGLYAIAGWADAPTNQTSLIKFDTETGNATYLYQANFSWTKHSKSCFDDKLNIWYFIVQKWFNISNGYIDLQIILARYNLETNERLSDIKLNEYFNYINYVDCVGNPANGDLYLFGNNRYNNTVLLQLITSDSNNDYDIQINKIKDYEKSLITYSEIPGIGVQPIFDSNRNMIWFNGGFLPKEMWYYVDITTGDIMDIKEFGGIGNEKMGVVRSSTYDKDLDEIIGLQYSLPYNEANLTLGYFSLEYIDPVNLTQIEEKEQFKNYCPWYIHSPAIDLENEIFYVFLAEPIVDPDGNYCPIQLFSIVLFEMHIVGIDINTGKILTSPIMNDPNLPNQIYMSPSDVIFWDGQ